MVLFHLKVIGFTMIVEPISKKVFSYNHDGDFCSKTILAGCYKFGAATLLNWGGSTMTSIIEIINDSNMANVKSITFIEHVVPKTSCGTGYSEPDIIGVELNDGSKATIKVDTWYRLQEDTKEIFTKALTQRIGLCSNIDEAYEMYLLAMKNGQHPELAKKFTNESQNRQFNLPKELKGKKFRIRKLTPRECFRLMDVDDADIDKIQAAGIANTNQYKLAGNSIVVNVLYHIFRKMFIETEIDKNGNEPTQLTLF